MFVDLSLARGGPDPSSEPCPSHADPARYAVLSLNLSVLVPYYGGQDLNLSGPAPIGGLSLSLVSPVPLGAIIPSLSGPTDRSGDQSLSVPTDRSGDPNLSAPALTDDLSLSGLMDRSGGLSRCPASWCAAAADRRSSWWSSSCGWSWTWRPRFIITRWAKCFVLLDSHRRRIKTESKAKVVAYVWGKEFIKFLAALAIVH